MDHTGPGRSTEPAGGTPATDAVPKPITVAERAIDVAVWDGWSRSAVKANRIASRLALVVGLAAGLVSIAAGLALLSGAWAIAAVLYGPLTAWAVSSWIRATTRTANLKTVVIDMRRSLSPSAASEFNSDVLIAMLTSPRVPAGTHHSFVTVEREDQHVNIAVVQYDMSQLEPWDYPNGASGGG